MNVLIIQENGRHDKNRMFRECFSLQRSFVKLGHNAVVWGLGHENYNDNINYNDFDLILNLENHAHTAGNWLPDISSADCKKFLWSIDAHVRGVDPYEQEFNRGKYDILLHSTKNFVNSYYHVWFPNCFDDTLLKPKKLNKVHKFGFCGNYVNRKDLLQKLENDIGLHLDIFVIGDDMVDAINKYECHFNCNIGWGRYDEINYRCFETIGCGTLLLTSAANEYSELGFVDGKNCLIYNSIDEIYEKVDFINNNDCSHIAKAGLELSKAHTYDKRVASLIELYRSM
jgi:hypothetical protein